MPQNEIINSKGNNQSASNLATLLIDHLSKNNYLQTAEALITSKEEMPNSIKIKKRNIFNHCS